jgi:hypothetical protein
MSLTTVSINTLEARYNVDMAQEEEPHSPSESTNKEEGSRGQDIELDESTRRRWIDIAHRHFADSFVSTLAEARFSQSGLLDVFEESGILPRADNPNPHDANLSPSEHEQWWADHPEAAESFDRNIRLRDERLRLLYIGALFGVHLRRFRD